MNTLIGWKPVGDKNIASSRLRAFIPCQNLATLGWPVELFNPAHQTKYRMVIFQKAYAKADITLAQELKKNGTIVVLDQCDNHFYNPVNDPVLAERALRLKEMVELADYITASTNEIANLFPGKKTFVVDDFIELPGTNVFRKFWYGMKSVFSFDKRGVTKIVWFGNAGSENPRFGMIDVTSILEPLEKVHKQSPIELTIISNSEKDFSRYLKGKTLFKINYIPWHKDSYEYLVQQHDLCVIPIHQNPFTVCKTNNRVVLTLLLGVPVIADSIPSYEEFSPYIVFSDWEKNCFDYIRHNEKHRTMVREGQIYIQNKYSPENITSRWEHIFSTILERKN
jgi:hypothetical protein